MAFVIECTECGNKQTFNPGDNARNTHIDMLIGDTGGYQPAPNEITIYCENQACNHSVDLTYK